MLLPRDDILQQALALPPADRAFVAKVLGQSLGPDDTQGVSDALAATGIDAITGEEFAEELRRRSAAYRAGTTSARPVDDVLADLRRRQAEQTS